MRSPRSPRRALLATVGAIVGALLLLGCGTDAQLEALHADPMATWSAPGMSEVGGHETEPGTALGKPRYARVLRILSVPDGDTAVDAVAVARRAAVESGWSVDGEHRGWFGAEKSFTIGGQDFRGDLSVGPQAVGAARARAREIYVSLTLYPA